MREDGFYLVWNPSTNYTQRQHKTFEAAKAEAKRLAAQNKGSRFYVLGALGCAVVNEPIQWIENDFDLDAAIPF